MASLVLVKVHAGDKIMSWRSPPIIFCNLLTASIRLAGLPSSGFFDAKLLFDYCFCTAVLTINLTIESNSNRLLKKNYTQLSNS